MTTQTEQTDGSNASVCSSLPSPTSGGCKCGECHWCKWQTDPVEAIKMLINGMVERDSRLEASYEEKRSFYMADKYRDSRKGKLEILGWIERQQEAERS
jgi:hypothetical protein